jgi:hypothetical protein
MAEQVEVKLGQSEFKVDVGATVTATAVVRNRGTVVDQYALALEGLDPAWWEVVPATVSLFPQDEATTTITIHPPAEAVAGTHPFQVRAVSSDDPSRSASVDATLYVAQAGGMVMTLDPTLVAGRSGSYAVRVTNRANAEAQLQLSGRDQEEGLEYEFEPASMLVAPFADSESQLTVRPSARPLWGVPKPYPFTVRAVPDGQEEPAAEADGELEYRPLLRPLALPAGKWRWLLTLIPLLALALLIRSLLQPEAPAAPTPTPTVVAAQVKPTSAPPTAAPKVADAGAGGGQVAPPVIQMFQVIREGEKLSLSWKVVDAEKVALNGKEVPLEGKEPMTVPADQGYELKASNPGGTAVKRINTIVFPPPVVKSFGANPPEVYAGQPTVLRWEIDNAERGRIDSQEAKVPQGWLEVRPDITRDYLLWAENGMGWVVHRVNVKVLPGDPPPAGPQLYTYDFNDGALDWELGTGVWSRVPWQGGYALRGAGHGFARLTAHSGDISMLGFRFQLNDEGTSLHANLLESVIGPHTRYFVSLAPGRVSINRQEGESFKELAAKQVKIEPKVTHSARILVGGGSIDLFVDDQPLLGVDDAGPPPGQHISFESLRDPPVHIETVEVQIGPEPATHQRAPRM